MLTDQCVIENISENAYVFKVKANWYLYDREVGKLYKINSQ